MALTPEAHLEWILDQLSPLPVRQHSLANGFHHLYGTVLAEDFAACHPLPLWDNSAMDGYAVRAADTLGASDSTPVTLRVLGEIPAGSTQDPALEPGQAVRIMTGAPLPTDADAVLRVEDTLGEDGQRWGTGQVTILREVQPGKDIRHRGEDRAAGDLVAVAGQQVDAALLSALAAAGAEQLLVRPLPTAAVLVTGAELQEVGAVLQRGQIPESNSWLMQGLLTEAGITQITVQRCTDDTDLVREQLARLGASHDVVISTGGVGPGTHDVMRQVLQDEPGVRAVRVALRPGAPQCAGRLESGAMMFALPGNPVSAAVGFELFVRPALRALQGNAQLHRPRLRATAAVGWKSPVGRLQVLPVVFDPVNPQLCAPAVQAQAISHSVGGFGAAEGYALVGPEQGDVQAGDQVEVLRVKP